MQTHSRALPAFVTKALPYVERISIGLLILSGIMMSAEIGGGLEVFMLAMLTLAITFFLNARIPTEVSDSEGAHDFKELLALQIVPKVLWISASISIIGILFYYLKLSGFSEMLLIGAMTTVTALTILALMLPVVVKYPAIFRPILVRIVPVFAVCCYLLFTVVFV